MDKEKLRTIPTPASQRWREFRIQILPFIVFLGILSGIVYLWKTYVQPIGVIGLAETNQVNITSLQDGLLERLLVERFQSVTQGQVVAVIVNTDPDLLKAQVAVVQTDLDVMRTRMEIDRQRTIQGYQQLRVDLMAQQVARAVAEAKLMNAVSNYTRVAELVRSNVLSQSAFDAAKAERDALQAEVDERNRLMEDLRDALSSLTNAVSNTSQAQDPIAAAVDAKANELNLMLKPTALKSPITGMVSLVHHLPGERILRGTP